MLQADRWTHNSFRGCRPLDQRERTRFLISQRRANSDSTLELSLPCFPCCCCYYVIVVQWLGHGQFFATPRTAAHQVSLSFTISRSLLKLMSIELVMPSNLQPSPPLPCPSPHNCLPQRTPPLCLTVTAPLLCSPVTLPICEQKRLTHPFHRLAHPGNVLQEWRPFWLEFLIASLSLTSYKGPSIQTPTRRLL